MGAIIIVRNKLTLNLKKSCSYSPHICHVGKMIYFSNADVNLMLNGMHAGCIFLSILNCLWYDTTREPFHK